MIHRWLAVLHGRGLHAAVLAGLVLAPAVVAAGYLTDHGAEGSARTALDPGPLRGTFSDGEPSRPSSGF